MVKYIDIIKAINDKIKTKFPAIQILSESDVEEKIARPSFMTMLDGIKQKDFQTVSIEKEMTARIYYFASNKDKNKIENLNMIDSLDELFLEDNQITANNFNISIEEADAEVIDKVLHYNFDISFSQDYDIDKNINVEVMDEIHLEMVKEE